MSLRLAPFACSAAVLALVLGGFLGSAQGRYTPAGPERLAHLQATNAERTDVFGGSVALSADGTLLLVGADLEASASAASPQDNSLPGAGAAYVFERKVSGWSQQQMLKAAQPAAGAGFGFQTGVSRDGTLLVVAAPFEAVAPEAEGRLHLFSRDGARRWRAQDTLDAPAGAARYGIELALARDGATLAAVGVDGDGRAQVFTHVRTDAGWRALGPGLPAGAGAPRLAMAGDGQRLVVAQPATGVVRVFERAGHEGNGGQGGRPIPPGAFAPSGETPPVRGRGTVRPWRSARTGRPWPSATGAGGSTCGSAGDRHGRSPCG